MDRKSRATTGQMMHMNFTYLTHNGIVWSVIPCCVSSIMISANVKIPYIKMWINPSTTVSLAVASFASGELQWDLIWHCTGDEERAQAYDGKKSCKSGNIAPVYSSGHPKC